MGRWNYSQYNEGVILRFGHAYNLKPASMRRPIQTSLRPREKLARRATLLCGL